MIPQPAIYSENVISADQTPIVSIIIPTYNASDYILTSIESAIGQTYANLDIIIIDDGSTDDTADILQNLIEAGDIRYIYQQNKGAAAARNTGIKNAEGNYIAFLDADDRFDLSMVNRCMEELMAHDYDLVSVDNYMVFLSGNDEVRREAEEYAWIEQEPEPLFLTFLKVGGIGGVHKAVFRKSVFDRVGLLDESLPVYEDLDLWIRIAKNGLSWGHIREKLVFYSRRDDNNSLITASAERNQDCRIRILRRYSSEAIKYSPAMKQILAGQLWQFGISYISDYTSIVKATRCFIDSQLMQPDIGRIFRSLKNYLFASSGHS